jgi:N-acetylglucosaminyldiphosphoundecaprenol N-acetyl-beta-D-mannosaminyltransferase
MNEHYFETIPILGTNVDAFSSMRDTVQWIRRRIAARTSTFCVAINPEKIYRARQDIRLSRVLESAHLRICDGIGVSVAARLLHGKRLPRCTGVDLFLTLTAMAWEQGWKVYLLGASRESNVGARRVLSATFPGLRIAGNRDGYFDDSQAMVQRINDSGADLLFAAMGSPRQEFWIAEHLPHLKPVLCMGVGGSLDIVSGTVHRAPGIFRRTGLEWLYRLLLQPGRLRRQVSLPLFAFDVLRAAAMRHS